MTPEQWMDAWHQAWQWSLTKHKTYLLCPTATDPETIAENARIRRSMKFERRYYQAHTNYIVSVYSTPR